MIALTPIQKRAYDYIRATIAASGGVGPTYQEVADHLGCKSKGHVCRVIEALKARGYLQTRKGCARSFEIINQANPCPHCQYPVGSEQCRAAAARQITYSSTPKQQVAA